MGSADAAEIIGGRYAVVGELASGGMATVFLARRLGAAGFSKVVALKRMHPHLARQPELVGMFLDEARLAAQVRHANVVPTVDVVEDGGEVLLVMEYVLGESLGGLLRAARGRVPLGVAAAIAVGLLEGLHAAHEARGTTGAPLGLVHRDVSPQNVIVGADGVPRVLDFGIAKAAGQAALTREGQVRGKVGYMAPEQYRGETLDRRVDVYAAGVVLWEMLTGRRLFVADDPLALALRVANDVPPAPSRFAPDVTPALDAVVARALAKDRDARFATARELAEAIERAAPSAPARSVARWVEEVAGDVVAARARAVEAAAAAAPSAPASVPTAPASSRPGSTAWSSPPPAAPARRRRLAIAAAGAAALVVALSAVFLVVTRARTHAPAIPSAPVLADAPTPAAADPQPATPAITTLEAPAATPPTPEASAPVSPAASPSPTGAPHHTPRRARSRTTAPAATCQPPWRLTAEGLRELKPECR